jgi:hypothetical protein
MPSAWSEAAPDADAPDNTWNAESADGTESLTVLRMPWRPTDPPGKWRLALDAVIGIRRKVDREQHGPGTTLSEPEFYAHPTSPGEMYLLHDPAGPTRVATLVRATQGKICVFLLRNDTATEPAFHAHAKAVLDAMEVTP